MSKILFTISVFIIIAQTVYLIKINNITGDNTKTIISNNGLKYISKNRDIKYTSLTKECIKFIDIESKKNIIICGSYTIIDNGDNNEK